MRFWKVVVVMIGILVVGLSVCLFFGMIYIMLNLKWFFSVWVRMLFEKSFVEVVIVMMFILWVWCRYMVIEVWEILRCFVILF